MLGFYININGKSTKVPINPNGMFTVNLFVNNGENTRMKDGECRVYIGGIDYQECKEIIWNDFSSLSINDSFEIRVTEIDVPSVPILVKEDKDIKRPMTKMELFHFLENELKKQGLI